jgi:beta-galactosidase
MNYYHPKVAALACCSVILASVVSMPICAAGREQIATQLRRQKVVSSSQRTKYAFNAAWRVFVGDPKGAEASDFDDSNWKRVSTPYAWNEDSAFKKSIRDLPTGVAWYRKHFKVPKDGAGKKVFLEFEGIRHGGEFYLNGVLLGRHENGVMAFGFDISQHVRPSPQENVLAVRTDNSWDYREKATNSTYQWSDRNFYANYGGINKNVYLHITDKLYQTLPLYSNLATTGIYVYAQNFDIKGKKATVTAESQIRNEYDTGKTFSYEVIIQDMGGRILKTINGGQHTLAAGETRTVKASARFNGLNFWSWGYGYLYNIHSILKVNGQSLDVVRIQTGFRKIEFANGVVKLNNRVIHLKGYAQRTTNEWPAVGSSVSAWLSDFSNRKMVESNANLVRWMHVTPWKQDVESCDRVGLMQAMPAGDSERDADGRRWEQRVELMRDAIIYNRNNPSIVFYESGNKAVSEEHMRQMKALRDLFDPHGGRAVGSREMLNSKTAEYGGEMLYINKSSSKPLWATEYSRDEGLRKYWDEFSPPFHKDGDGPLYRDQDASAYNRNQDSHAIENVARWYDYWRERPGTGRRVNAGGVNIIFSDTNTHYRGAENYRRSGEVDAMRIPKDGFFAHQVMWDGWVDVERPRIHIIGHWNYEPGTKKDVYVVTSGERVKLYINGVSQGFGEQSHRFLFTFRNITWRSGILRAVAYDQQGTKISETQKRTAGKPARIRLTARTGPGGLQADGSDLALIDIQVVDSEGNRCPTALDKINFSISGPAEWRGGIAQGPDNYILSRTLPVEGGLNRALIRSQTKSGRITLTASAEGLKSARVEIFSRPVVVRDGLSPALPGVGLPSNLGRGPTPPATALTVTRNPVRIARVTAGANVDQAVKSFDDDETTDWSSDGTLKTGWIKYDFERQFQVSEVVFKFVSWRTQSYSIRILVDDKVVFSGNTPRSLGYATIKFAPLIGSSLKVELMGGGNNRDAFGNIIDIPGTPDPTSAAGRKTGQETLGIVEIEVYQPAARLLGRAKPIPVGLGVIANTR